MADLGQPPVDWTSRARDVVPKVCNYWDGRPIATTRHGPIRKASPRDGTELYRYWSAGASEIDAAVGSARKAFSDGRWARLPAARRKERLCRLADLLEQHHEELALLDCLDVGKPITDAFNFDIPTATAAIRHAAEAADKLYGKVYGADGRSLSYELRRPVGVVGALVGWNFPILLAVSKVGPALAAGNSIVLKPSELSCLSTVRLATLAHEAGIP